MITPSNKFQQLNRGETRMSPPEHRTRPNTATYLLTREKWSSTALVYDTRPNTAEKLGATPKKDPVNLYYKSKFPQKMNPEQAKAHGSEVTWRSSRPSATEMLRFQDPALTKKAHCDHFIYLTSTGVREPKKELRRLAHLTRYIIDPQAVHEEFLHKLMATSK